MNTISTSNWYNTSPVLLVKKPNDNKKLTSLEKCENSLVKKLLKLKSLGVLNHSVTPRDSSSDFEILEFYGDSVLSERIAYFMMKTKRFLSPDLLTKLKVACVCNANLQRCYEKLNLDVLIDSRTKPENKSKADVVEAILGELAEAMNSQESSPHQSKIRAVLDGLLTFISFNGEQAFFQDSTQSAPITAQMSKSPSPPKQPMPSQGKAPISPPKRSGGSPPKRPADLPSSPQRAPLALPSATYRAPATNSVVAYRSPAAAPSVAPRVPAESPQRSPVKKSNSSPTKRVTWSPTNEINEIKSDSPVALPNRNPSPPRCVKSILKHQQDSMVTCGSVYNTNQQKTIEWKSESSHSGHSMSCNDAIDDDGTSVIPKLASWEELVAWSNSALAVN